MDENNNKNISARIPRGMSEFIEEYRWRHRKTRADIVHEALTDWCKNRGYSADVVDSEGDDQTQGAV